MISYMEMGYFSFQPIIPLHSNLGLERDPKLKKAAQELHVFSRNQDCSVQLSNGYPNMISYVETKNFDFQPIIPLRSNISLECDPKLRKNGPRTIRLCLQSKPRVQLSNGYPNMISYLQMNNFNFQKSPSFGVNKNRL